MARNESGAGLDANDIAKAITEGIIAAQPKREKTPDEHRAEKLARDPRPKPNRPTFQNGFDVNPRGLSVDTIKKLDALKAGSYMGGKVTIQNVANGGINIRYTNNTPDTRMELMALFSSFSDLVHKLYDEMKARAGE